MIIINNLAVRLQTRGPAAVADEKRSVEQFCTAKTQERTERSLRPAQIRKTRLPASFRSQRKPIEQYCIFPEQKSSPVESSTSSATELQAHNIMFVSIRVLHQTSNNNNNGTPHETRTGGVRRLTQTKINPTNKT